MSSITEPSAGSLLGDHYPPEQRKSAILAALYHREKTGRGQFVEIPMFETMVAFIMVEHLHGLGFEPARHSYRMDIDLSGEAPRLVREGQGDIRPFGFVKAALH